MLTQLERPGADDALSDAERAEIATMVLCREPLETDVLLARLIPGWDILRRIPARQDLAQSTHAREP